MNGKSMWPKIASVIWLPLMVVAGLASLVLALSMGANLLGAVLFAIVAVALTVLLVYGAQKEKYGGEDLESLLHRASGLTLEDRRAQAKKELEETRFELRKSQQRKNAKEFWSKVLVVALYLSLFLLLMYRAFGLYPEEVLLMPWPAVAITWLIILRFIPRTMIIVLLLTLTALSLAVFVMGPTILLTFLPYILIMPMMMVMNFGIMFGPLMFMNLKQIRIVRPGEAMYGVDFDEIRGQDEAKEQLLMALATFSYQGEEEPLFREKGVLMEGPPGTGKTMMAKATGTRLRYPIILTNGTAFTSTFIGIGIFVMMYLKWRAESLAGQFGGCVVFIDEAEQLLRSRGGEGAGSESQANSPFFYMPHNQFGLDGDLVFETPESQEMAWRQKEPTDLGKVSTHPMMMGAGMGMMGAGMALPVLLDWMDGIPTPPMMSRLWRSTFNWLMDILIFVPSAFRLPPANATVPNIFFMAATNMAQVIDRAMLRPGRLGTTVHFVYPGEKERQDIADLYFTKANEKKALDRKILNKEKIAEFARAAVFFSPAQIMQAIYSAQSIRKTHIARLKLLKGRVESTLENGEKLEEVLDQKDLRFWKRNEDSIKVKGWDNPVANWESILEAIRVIRFGMAKPTRTNEKHRERTAYHEIGHFLNLRAFDADYMKPITLSVMPRGQALGMVAHVPVEEHDPQPQPHWEGMLRIMVASIPAERVFYTDHQPGVVSDLENATKLAAFMAGIWGFPPRPCNETEKERYLRYGEMLLSIRSGGNAMGMGGVDPTSSILMAKKDEVRLFLGQAFVDAYRLTIKNKDLFKPIADRLQEVDEIMGAELDELWEQVGRDIKLLDKSDLEVWPDSIIDVPSPFYERSN